MRLVTSWIARTALLAALAPGALAGGVVIVGQGGSLSYATIQDAVNAAAEGDLLLVAEGSYPGFTIQDRSLGVFAAPGASVEVAGQVEVSNLSAGRVVVLSGLRVTGATTAGAAQAAAGLRLAYNEGHVRVEDCTFLGDHANALAQNAQGGHGAQIVNCARVVLSRSSFNGGTGREKCGGFGCDDSRGGTGLFVRNSRVAVHASALLGGPAGYYEACGGDGGVGASVFASEVWLTAVSVQGGHGEYSCIGAPGPGGDGGNGLVILSGSVQALEVTLAGGFAGYPSGSSGLPLVNSGSFTQQPGSARRAQFATVLDDLTPNAIELTGVAGDRVWLPDAVRPGFRSNAVPGGPWLVPTPARMPFVPAGTLPTGGSLTVLQPTPGPSGTASGRLAFAQVYALDLAGPAWLGTPLHQLVLARDGTPDCDGNGVLDYLDALADPARDCNGNLVLDACELAAGTVPDCNANGIPDACDIAAESSTDLDLDGVPDECQPAITLWVDAAAAAGGNGSPGAPFQSLAEALAAAGPQHLLVLIRDGLYVGALNRDLDLAGRRLLFKSESGPTGCVVDLQGAGRLAALTSGAAWPAGFRGLTIRNGSAPEGGVLYVEGADAGLRDCVIEGGAATGAGGGGALHVVDGRVEVQGSQLRGCTAPAGKGGAVHVGAGGFLDLSTSLLIDNSAREGGALALTGDGGMIVTHSRWIANAATAGDGGAIRAQQDVWTQSYWILASNCLFAGNSATGRGGALWLSGTTYGGNFSSARLYGVTLSANGAGSQGGAIFSGDNVRCYPSNSVLWGNTAPLGAQLALDSAGWGLVTARSCDLQGGAAGIHNPAGFSVKLYDSLDLDPLFLDPDGPDGDPLTFEDNDYRLAPGSPCIDAGNNDWMGLDYHDIDRDGLLAEPPPLDLLLQPRPLDDPAVPDTGKGSPPLVDMGALERQP